ncbi:DNA-directed RNA polymerase subunit omega [Natronogracilivirga saccharolytica]|uniref:DNA-directed RNA polymerase subunit omega n=1 Tax=Natronogracilivirga saccharolytica TaxID=2812953 RepID=A0A8J7UT68_9BACT|nr:DNA-directed RNA polymerase subunit omega [Natronogracilivirga saccharolytica]MBP3191045.1 DNA-directed RNA polymerase subunit omega [Natronogracilivirga saccharolytica]
MAVKSLDLEKIQSTTGNIYEGIVILSKRARQIAAQEKMELDEKLKYFEGFEEEEEYTFNEEQERITKEYEARPHPTQRAVNELIEEKIYYRGTENDEENS